MHYIKKLVALAVIAMVATGLNATLAAAGEYQVTVGGAPYTGNLDPTSEDGATVFYSPASGQAITCSHSHMTAVVTASEVGPGTTIFGTLGSLTFAQSGNSFCPSTITGITNCETEVNNLPYTMRIDTTFHNAPALSINNASITLHCNSFIGRIECQLSAPNITANMFGDEVRFISEPLTSGSGFPCPGDLTYTATYDLRTRPGGQVLSLTEQ